MTNFYTDNPDLAFQLEHSTWRASWPARGRLRPGPRLRLRAARPAPTPATRTGATLEIAGEIAGEFVAPRAEDVDRARQRASWTARSATRPASPRPSSGCAQADLMGMTLPRRYGGLNLPVTVSIMVIEMVARADAALMNIFGLQDIAETINKFGDEEIKAAYLPRFASGEVTGAMALTEPEAGSDLQNVQLKASRGEPTARWRLNGVKRFITNGCGQVLPGAGAQRGGHRPTPAASAVPLRARRAHAHPPPRGQARHPRLAHLRAAVHRRAGAARRRAPARPHRRT